MGQLTPLLDLDRRRVAARLQKGIDPHWSSFRPRCPLGKESLCDPDRLVRFITPARSRPGDLPSKVAALHGVVKRLSFVDAYSRYVVHHKLLISLNGEAVATELQVALEAAQDAKPRVVHDHGSEFVNRDVAAVIKVHNLIDIKTKPRHPESNGIVERFNGTVRADSDNGYGYLQAEATIAKLMYHYNEQRLHAALGCMTPATWHRGDPQQVREERARRIAVARAHRKTINQQRSNQAA